MWRDREVLFSALSSMLALTVWPSAVNFILFRVEGWLAQAVHEELKSKGILIKCLDGSHPALCGCLRVTVGSVAENAAFIMALKRIMDSAQKPARGDRP